MTTPSQVKEYSLSPNFMEEFGFVSARVVNGYLILRHKSGEDIGCEFDSRNLARFKKKLENAISRNENGIEFDSGFNSRKFTRKFIDILVKDTVEECEKLESARRQEQNDKQKIIDEINKDKTSLEISLEEWEQIRMRKYQILEKTVKENLPSVWLPLEFTLSEKCILNVEDITLPFAGIVLGAPSTLKTVSLIMLNK